MLLGKLTAPVQWLKFALATSVSNARSPNQSLEGRQVSKNAGRDLILRTHGSRDQAEV